jgi:hypothetical protein
MQKMLAALCLLGVALPLGAAEFQGYLSDWSCTKRIVKNGVEQTLQNDKSCRLQGNYKRSAYGLITDSKKFYRLDGAGNALALHLLSMSPSQDQVHVVVKGDVKGDVLKVKDMSIL